jgi:Transposase IS116/IS110/IS902 family
MASEVGDIERFASPGELCGSTGLCPRVIQSGGTDCRGPISKHGRQSAGGEGGSATARRALRRAKCEGAIAGIHQKTGPSPASPPPFAAWWRLQVWVQLPAHHSEEQP